MIKPKHLILNAFLKKMIYSSHKKSKMNKLSWSNTRITLLEYCEKKYYLNYYTFALKNFNEELRRNTLISKKLKSLEMWMGEKTHLLISDYLKLLQAGEATAENIQKIKEGIAEEMRYEFELSKEKDYETLNFESWGGLSEHFYHENVDERLDPTIQRVFANLDALISSPWIERIQEWMRNSNAIYIENPKNPDFEAMKVEIDKIQDLKDISIMASPDFWIIFWGNRYLILDRKSGKEPQYPIDIADQIKVYALKLLLKKKKMPVLWDIMIEGYEIFLPSMHSYGGNIEQKDIDMVIEKIKQDTRFQSTFLVDQDPVKNKPLPSSSFSPTAESWKCETCTFRKVCHQLRALE